MPGRRGAGTPPEGRGGGLKSPGRPPGGSTHIDGQHGPRFVHDVAVPRAEVGVVLTRAAQAKLRGHVLDEGLHPGGAAAHTHELWIRTDSRTRQPGGSPHLPRRAPTSSTGPSWNVLETPVPWRSPDGPCPGRPPADWALPGAPSGGQRLPVLAGARCGVRWRGLPTGVTRAPQPTRRTGSCPALSPGRPSAQWPRCGKWQPRGAGRGGGRESAESRQSSVWENALSFCPTREKQASKHARARGWLTKESSVSPKKRKKITLPGGQTRREREQRGRAGSGSAGAREREPASTRRRVRTPLSDGVFPFQGLNRSPRSPAGLDVLRGLRTSRSREPEALWGTSPGSRGRGHGGIGVNVHLTLTLTHTHTHTAISLTECPVPFSPDGAGDSRPSAPRDSRRVRSQRGRRGGVLRVVFYSPVPSLGQGGGEAHYTPITPWPCRLGPL